MFRAYAYFSKSHNPVESIAFRSEPFETKKLCEQTLECILATAGFTGGGIEQLVPGIGWVLDDDVETAVICSRRNESDGE
jgi:hypothetical protein